MIEAHGFWSYVALISAVLILGGIGGFIGCLLKNGLGQIERGRALRRTRDLGWWADVFIGAVAALIGLALLTPEETITTIKDDVQTSASRYNIIALAAMAVAVGSAGNTFIGAFQARYLAQAKEDEKKKVADSTLDLAQAIEDDTPRDELINKAKEVRAIVKATTAG